MAKTGISIAKINAHIADEQKDRNKYGMDAAAAKMGGDKEASAVLSNISREEHGHASRLKSLAQRGSMKSNPKEDVLHPNDKRTDFTARNNTSPNPAAETTLNQDGDSDMHAHSKEAMDASTAMGKKG